MAGDGGASWRIYPGAVPPPPPPPPPRTQMRCLPSEAALCAQSTREHTWTTGHKNGPNHLGLLNKAADYRIGGGAPRARTGPPPARPPRTVGETVILMTPPHVIPIETPTKGRGGVQ